MNFGRWIPTEDKIRQIHAQHRDIDLATVRELCAELRSEEEVYCYIASKGTSLNFRGVKKWVPHRTQNSKREQQKSVIAQKTSSHSVQEARKRTHQGAPTATKPADHVSPWTKLTSKSPQNPEHEQAMSPIPPQTKREDHEEKLPETHSEVSSSKEAGVEVIKETVLLLPKELSEIKYSLNSFGKSAEKCPQPRLEEGHVCDEHPQEEKQQAEQPHQNYGDQQMPLPTIYYILNPMNGQIVPVLNQPYQYNSPLILQRPPTCEGSTMAPSHFYYHS